MLMFIGLANIVVGVAVLYLVHTICWDTNSSQTWSTTLEKALSVIEKYWIVGYL